MEIQVGDVFRRNCRSVLFKVISIYKFEGLCQVVSSSGVVISRTIEHKNTLLKMKKLSSLEKELM